MKQNTLKKSCFEFSKGIPFKTQKLAPYPSILIPGSMFKSSPSTTLVIQGPSTRGPHNPF
jgi:hypothetical protein